MTVTPRPHPAALPHGELTEVLPEIWLVTGTVQMAPMMRFSRNMAVIREGERLVLVNTVRLDDAGLQALDRLGRVTDVIRLAGFHGMDDPFYAERYGARVWAPSGQRYVAGFDPEAPVAYFAPHVAIEADTALPLAGARVVRIDSRPPEALLLLDRAGGVLVAGDALQHMRSADRYFSFVGKWTMKAMGFLHPHNVGPGWLRQARPDRAQLRALLDLEFEHVIPTHGEVVIGGAREAFRPAIERAAR